MKWADSLIVGALSVVLAVGLILLATHLFKGPSTDDRKELAECHAANPGFDCRRGYVKGEPFNATP